MRIVKHIIIIAGLLFTFNISAQNNLDTLNLKSTCFRLHVIPIGFGIEQSLLNNITLIIDIGSGITGEISNYSGRNHYDVKPFPYFLIESRYYTRIYEKYKNGNEIKSYSGTYGSVLFSGGSDINSENWKIKTGPVVGYQKSFGNFMYFNISIGVGCLINEYNTGYGVIGNLEFGFLL